MTNQKHPLESVAKILDYLANDWQGKDGAHTVNEEAKYALTTLREYIANEEKVEGLAEDLTEEKLNDLIDQAMNYCWNDWCADTGSVPCDFQRKHGKTYFTAGKWASKVSKQVFRDLQAAKLQIKRQGE